jgi:hypothetical protein
MHCPAPGLKVAVLDGCRESAVEAGERLVGCHADAGRRGPDLFTQAGMQVGEGAIAGPGSEVVVDGVNGAPKLIR